MQLTIENTSGSQETCTITKTILINAVSMAIGCHTQSSNAVLTNGNTGTPNSTEKFPHLFIIRVTSFKGRM